MNNISDLEKFLHDVPRVLDQIHSRRVVQVLLELIQGHIVGRCFLAPFKKVFEVALKLLMDVKLINCKAVSNVHTQPRPLLSFVVGVVFCNQVVGQFQNLC